MVAAWVASKAVPSVASMVGQWAVLTVYELAAQKALTWVGAKAHLMAAPTELLMAAKLAGQRVHMSAGESVLSLVGAKVVLLAVSSVALWVDMSAAAKADP